MAEQNEDLVPKKVMLERVAEERSKVEALQSKVAGLQSEAATVEQLKQTLDDTLKSYSSLESTYKEDKVLWGNGITDPEVQDFVRWRHQKLDVGLEEYVKDHMGSDKLASQLLSKPKAEVREEAPRDTGLQNPRKEAKRKAAPAAINANPADNTDPSAYYRHLMDTDPREAMRWLREENGMELLTKAARQR